MDMSAYDRLRKQATPDRLYRDTDHAILAGVCAGIAEYLGIGRLAVRLLAVISLLFFMPFTVLAYLVLAVVLPRRPRDLYRGEENEAFWRSVRVSPQQTFGDVRHRFRDLERRLQRMEGYVTSERYNLDREFRNLER
jgi:phage shock protein C